MKNFEIINICCNIIIADINIFDSILNYYLKVIRNFVYIQVSTKKDIVLILFYGYIFFKYRFSII